MTNRQGRRRRHKRHKERTKIRWGNHVLEVWVREMRELFKFQPFEWRCAEQLPMRREAKP